MPSHSRRRILKALGGSAAVGLAGCIGADDTDPVAPTDDDDDTVVEDDDDDVEPVEEVTWPPPRNLVALANDSEPGGLIDMLARLWQPYFNECAEGDVTLAIQNEPQAGGVIMTNRVYQEEAHGGVMGSMRAISLIVNQIGRDDADYDVLDFHHVVRFSADTRALQMNPVTMPIEDHFDITWEDFVDYALEQDDPLIQPVANPAQRVLAQYFYGSDPNLVIGEHIEFVTVSGGSEARAAFARGDADLYMGSYVSNITTRNDFYYTQFVMIDPDADPEFYDDVKQVTPEFSPIHGDNPSEKVLENYVDQAAIVNIDAYPIDAARTTVGLVSDHHIAFLPPATPPDIVEIHNEAWECAAASPDLTADVIDTFDEPDHNPLAGTAVQTVVEEKWDAIYGDEEIRNLIQTELF